MVNLGAVALTSLGLMNSSKLINRIDIFNRKEIQQLGGVITCRFDRDSTDRIFLLCLCPLSLSLILFNFCSDIIIIGKFETCTNVLAECERRWARQGKARQEYSSGRWKCWNEAKISFANENGSGRANEWFDAQVVKKVRQEFSHEFTNESVQDIDTCTIPGVFFCGPVLFCCILNRNIVPQRADVISIAATPLDSTQHIY